MKDRIIAVNSNCYHGYSLDDAIAGIRKAGFRYIELTATKGWTEHVFPTMPFSQLCAIRDKLRKAGLVPFSMSGHCNLMDASRMPDFEDNIQLAGFFGCQYIVSSIGEAHLEDRASAGNDAVARNLTNVLPRLAENNLTLVLEIHGEHGTGAAIDDIVQRVNSPRVRINYDTANAVFYGGVNPEEDLKACMHNIAYVHLKDKAGAQKEWNFPALGQGDINFPAIFEALEKAGNPSPFSIEIEFTQNGPKNLAEIDRAVQNSCNYLKNAGFAI